MKTLKNEVNMEDKSKEQEPKTKKQRTTDPGAARLGNFINYYQFNPAANRIVHLNDPQLLNTSPPPYCLDIGCNSGVSTYFSL